MDKYDAQQALALGRQFLGDNPDIETIEAFVTDLNGVSRGKWLPVADMDSLCGGAYKNTLTCATPDIWGRDVPALCEASGDGDAIHLPVVSSLKRIPWLKQPTAQLLLQQTWEGKPSEYDSREVLKKVLGRYEERGLTAVTAPELEFYLFLQERNDDGSPRLKDCPVSGAAHVGGQIYSTELLRDHADLLHEMRHTALTMGVPVTVLGKELSPGQWEINLDHVGCPLTSADNAQLLKRVIKNVAHQHGMLASFMAKPSADLDGSGYHTHVSVLDKDGDNIFNDGTDKGTPALRHAIGGLAATMADSFLMFAPHQNSFRRLHIGDHAPKCPTWGYENRYVSMRVPDGSPQARRIEHRVAGADANPYLVQAAVLAGVLHGLEHRLDPGEPCGDRESAEHGEALLPQTWQDARQQFENSDYIRDTFGAAFQHAFSELKKFEQQQFDRFISKQEYDTYLVSA